MYHPCACCELRFGTVAELAVHVREDHAAAPPPERVEKILRQRSFDWSAHRTAFDAPPRRA